MKLGKRKKREILTLGLKVAIEDRQWTDYLTNFAGCTTRLPDLHLCFIRTTPSQLCVKWFSVVWPPLQRIHNNHLCDSNSTNDLIIVFDFTRHITFQRGKILLLKKSLAIDLERSFSSFCLILLRRSKVKIYFIQFDFSKHFKKTANDKWVNKNFFTHFSFEYCKIIFISPRKNKKSLMNVFLP